MPWTCSFSVSTRTWSQQRILSCVPYSFGKSFRNGFSVSAIVKVGQWDCKFWSTSAEISWEVCGIMGDMRVVSCWKRRKSWWDPGLCWSWKDGLDFSEQKYSTTQVVRHDSCCLRPKKGIISHTLLFVEFSFPLNFYLMSFGNLPTFPTRNRLVS